MNQNQAGWVVIATAIGLMAVNIADTVADLHAWHDATTPQFVAAGLRQFGGTMLAALGGKMTTQFGTKGDPS